MSDFFSVNMPYGMKRSPDGERWLVYNREYQPLGSNGSRSITSDIVNSSLYSSYKGLTEKKLLSIACDQGVTRNEQGEIVQIWLYNGETNPAPGNIGTSATKKRLWTDYCRRLRLLSALQTDD